MTILCLPLPATAFRKTPHDTPQGNKSHFNSWTRIILFSGRGTFSRKVKQICRILSSTVSINTYTQGRKKAVGHSHLLKGFAKNTHLSHSIKGVYRAGAHGVFPWLNGAGWRILVFFWIPKKQRETSKLRYPNGSKWYQFQTTVLVICQLSESFYLGGQSAKKSIWLNLILLAVKSSWGKSASRH